jgi:ubiquinone/menaquinone biosynthesis C-methylase UbiE
MPIDHFDLIAGFYDRAGTFIPSELLLRLLSLSPDNILLDAGGGTGRVAAALGGVIKKAFVADISRGMLRRAAGKGLATVCTLAEALPFPSGSIDRIIMMDALHHVMDQQQVAHELWRVLAPGGRILIIEPDFHKPVVKFLALGEKLLLMRSHFLTGEEIKSLFNDSDAEVDLLFNGTNVCLLAEKSGHL